MIDAQLFKKAFESAQENNAGLAPPSESTNAAPSAIPQTGAEHVESEKSTAATETAASEVVHGDKVRS